MNRWCFSLQLREHTIIERLLLKFYFTHYELFVGSRCYDVDLMSVTIPPVPWPLGKVIIVYLQKSTSAKLLEGRAHEVRKFRFDKIPVGIASINLVSRGSSINKSELESEKRISKKIVEDAKKNDVDVIAFENLKYIRKKMPKDRWCHIWAFDKLYSYVEYKAREKGIAVEQIDPRNTSRICNKCGCTEENNRQGGRFKCKECGYEVNADYNAAKNIGAKLLQRRQKSSSGAGHGQLALKSGTLKLNGTHVPTCDG